MPRSRRGQAAYYREKAEEIRRAARALAGADSRAQLERLAAQYEAVAAYFERSAPARPRKNAPRTTPRG